MSRPLLDFEVLTLDCYGTLIDWETGIWDALQPMIVANGLYGVTRGHALLEFARSEHSIQHDHPRDTYDRVLAMTHARLTKQFGGRANEEMDDAFGASLAHWPAFPDSAHALRYLKKHYRLVVLSNVHNDGFAASARKLGVEFDAVYTAEDIGSYKPATANFAYLLHHLELDFELSRNHVLHVAQGLFHDHVPANGLGLANAWIDRQHQRETGDTGIFRVEETVPDTMFVFSTLQDMADAVAAELEQPLT